MDRGYRGTLPAASERDDEAYLSFAEGLRAFTTREVAPVMNELGSAALRHAPPSTLEAVKAVLDPMPIVASRNRLMRSTQEMKWVGILETYGKREAELMAELDAAEQRGPGSVRYDPEFVYPDYFRSARCHLQPGGYAAHPLSGMYYHYGTKVFFTGGNDDDDLQRGIVKVIPTPADGQVRRILDLGCSAGQSATAFQEQYPNAEVHAIDISAPMVRYAHHRASRLNLPVRFHQMLAEQLDFPDNHFDIVHAFILFHEIPVDVGHRVIAEAYRVLRPGGVFAVVDFPNRPASGAATIAGYTRDFDTRDNGEQFANDFVYSDFPAALRAAGFRKVDPNAVPNFWLPVRVCEK